MFNALLRFGMALLLTAVVLAAWFVDLAIEYQRTADLNWTMLILIGAAVLAIALLVWELDVELPWSGHFATVAAIVALVWFLGVYFRFQAGIEMVGSTIRPPAVFALSALWLPTLAWFPYWPIPLGNRFTILCVLFLAQGVYPYLYRAAGPNDEGQWVARWRGDTRLDSIQRADANRAKPQAIPPIASPDPLPKIPPSQTAPSQPQPPAKPELFSLLTDQHRSAWTVFTQNEAKSSIEPPTPEFPLAVRFEHGAAPDLWNVQLSSGQLAVQKGHAGVVKFSVRVQAPTTIAVALTQNHEPWESIGLYRQLDLQPGTNNIQLTFNVDRDEPNAKLVFALAGNARRIEFASLEISARPASEPSTAPKTQQPEQPQPPTPAAQQPQPPSPEPDRSNQRFTGWSLITEPGFQATWTVTSPEGNLRANIQEPGTPKPWNVKLEWPVPTIEAGKKYLVKLRARASQQREITVDVTSPEPPWPSMGLYKQVAVTQDWTDIELPFTASAGGKARLHINLGGPPSQVEIESVEWKQIQ